MIRQHLAALAILLVLALADRIVSANTPADPVVCSATSESPPNCMHWPKR